MKKWEELEELKAPGGGRMSLWCRGDDYLIKVDGADLMSNLQHYSEEELARICCKGLSMPKPRVLVGGLGMGYTLRAALDALPADARVVVAELVPAVHHWNQKILGHLASFPLEDKRAEVVIGDVAKTMQSPPGFHAIILDVDNGPDGLTQDANDGLYTHRGIAMARDCLLPGGILGVWSVFEDKNYEKRLRQAGFDVETVKCAARLGKGGIKHTLFLARKTRSKGTPSKPKRTKKKAAQL